MVANHFPENSLMGVIWRVPARGIFHSLLYYPWVFLRMWMQQQAAIFWNSAIKWKTPSPVESAPYDNQRAHFWSTGCDTGDASPFKFGAVGVTRASESLLDILHLKLCLWKEDHHDHQDSSTPVHLSCQAL